MCLDRLPGEILSSRPEELYLEDFATITNVGMGYLHGFMREYPDHLLPMIKSLIGNQSRKAML